MNAATEIKEIELAMWEHAEAETLERKAIALRKRAAQRLARTHLLFREALDKAKTLRVTDEEGVQVEATRGLKRS